MKKKILIGLMVSIFIVIVISIISYKRHGCSDGTYIGDCSIPNHSYFCDDSKNLIFNCAYCGCPMGEKQICINNTCIDK